MSSLTDHFDSYDLLGDIVNTASLVARTAWTHAFQTVPKLPVPSFSNRVYEPD